MALNQHSYCSYFPLLFLFLAFAYSHSPFLSYEALKSGQFTGRSLLQAKKNCPVDMEGQNYTILTSKCKGPKYPATLCCEALLEFCCGFVDELNDMTNNCAETMFSYINLYGQYPPGLFANQCKEGKQGLSCDKALQAQAEKAEIKAASSASSTLLTPPRLLSLALASTFILYLLL
ncbi:GPI-anchored protein LLG1-like [Cucumis melo]|uniref:GPI-anchored protein LLG1-like n=2 Tax=Cucumis melo TaxID=3656 RepID=A0A1S4E0F2_CUCME|nr:GPI-anchored protein LLG1-like [Cucumis melo]